LDQPDKATPIWVGIVGSREVGATCTCQRNEMGKPHWEDCQMVVDWLHMLRVIRQLSTNYNLAGITSGGAAGADALAEDAAKMMEVPFKEYPVRSGPGAFASRAFARNSQIVAKSDRLIAFFAPGLLSRGTQDTIRKALAKGIPVHSLHEGKWYSGLPPVSSRP
jgi:hypothetical protein